MSSPPPEESSRTGTQFSVLSVSLSRPATAASIRDEANVNNSDGTPALDGLDTASLVSVTTNNSVAIEHLTAQRVSELEEFMALEANQDSIDKEEDKCINTSEAESTVSVREALIKAKADVEQRDEVRRAERSRRRHLQATRMRDRLGKSSSDGSVLRNEDSALHRAPSVNAFAATLDSSLPVSRLTQPCSSVSVPPVHSSTNNTQPKPNIPSSRSAATNLISSSPPYQNRGNTVMNTTPAHLSAPGGVLRHSRITGTTETANRGDETSVVSSAQVKSSVAFDVEFRSEGCSNTTDTASHQSTQGAVVQHVDRGNDRIVGQISW